MLLYYKLLENTATKNDKATMKVTLLKCSMQIISPNYVSIWLQTVYMKQQRTVFIFARQISTLQQIFPPAHHDVIITASPLQQFRWKVEMFLFPLLAKINNSSDEVYLMEVHFSQSHKVIKWF